MISKRLQHIVDIVTYFDTIADIGCDHGYVCIELIKNKKVKKAIASDISYPSLKKTIDYVKENNIEDKIETRVGNGLEILSTDEVDAVIIAGMGGVLISDILKNNYVAKFVEKDPLLILQPVQQAKDLRYYLYENKFEIVDEDYILDMGKYYNLIVAKKINKVSSDYLYIKSCKDVYMEYGILNIAKKNILLKKELENKIINSRNLFKELEQKQVKNSSLSMLSQKIKEMEEVYETL
jgi:SAM-dependent methyltransferase